MVFSSIIFYLAMTPHPILPYQPKYTSTQRLLHGTEACVEITDRSHWRRPDQQTTTVVRWARALVIARFWPTCTRKKFPVLPSIVQFTICASESHMISQRMLLTCCLVVHPIDCALTKPAIAQSLTHTHTRSKRAITLYCLSCRVQRTYGASYIVFWLPC